MLNNAAIVAWLAAQAGYWSGRRMVREEAARDCQKAGDLVFTARHTYVAAEYGERRDPTGVVGMGGET